jgi:hypothetical protein
VSSTTSSIRASAILLFLARTASGQTDATAETLFRDGKKLLADKRYDEACPKFAESARMEPSSGVQLALGLCLEAQGKTASAWGAYAAVVPLARRDGRADREKVAAAHAKALEPHMSRVTLAVDKTTAALDGLELREDGVVLGVAAWTDLPVDPGPHKIEVRAPHYDVYTTMFTVPVDHSDQAIPIPPLTLTPVAVAAVVAPPPPPPPAAANAPPWKVIGLATGGAGVASIAVGSVLGALALGKVNQANKACPMSPCANASAVSENGTAATLADASTGLFIAGGVLAAAGVLTFVLAPSSRDATRKSAGLSAAPVLAPAYIGLRGTF